MPSLFLFQCVALCMSVFVCLGVLPYKLVCACCTVCVCGEVRRNASKRAEGGKVKERDFFTNGLLFCVVEFMLQIYRLRSHCAAMQR